MFRHSSLAMESSVNHLKSSIVDLLAPHRSEPRRPPGSRHCKDLQNRQKEIPGNCPGMDQKICYVTDHIPHLSWSGSSRGAATTCCLWILLNILLRFLLFCAVLGLLPYTNVLDSSWVALAMGVFLKSLPNTWKDADPFVDSFQPGLEFCVRFYM